MDSEALVQKQRFIFARNMRKARREANLTQEQLAKRVNLTQPFVSAVERGTSNVGLDNAQRIAEAVGKPLYELLGPEK